MATALRSYQDAVDAFNDAAAAKLGLNRTDFRCINILDQHQPMTAGSLAHFSRLSTSAITFVVDRLEAAGFVQRRRDEKDRRRVVVELVPAAQQKVIDNRMPMMADARASLAGFRVDELAVVCKYLQVSTAVLERNRPI